MSNTVEIIVHPDVTTHQVSRYLYSHFAEHLGRCVYGGIWVGEDSSIENDGGIRLDTAEALKRLALPALRWPGGCFADNYHWMDGVGTRDQRPKRHNLWWRQPETNQFGTEEFMRLCRMIEAEPYICLNVGSGTVEEASSWVEYCNADQPTTLVEMRKKNGHPEPYNVGFWGIGNENWGCGGRMRPEYYANLYRRFATYVQKTAGDDAKLIACGSHDRIPEWDARFLEAVKDAAQLVDYIALHIYSGRSSSDVQFSKEGYYSLIAEVDVMDQHLRRAVGLAQAYSTDRHHIGVILDEWGSWYTEATVESGLYQQNTMRDALFAAASFHCFHQHGDRLLMTNMAQTVNVLQALVLTKGPEMIVTPTYHVYDMFRSHRDGLMVPCRVKNSPSLTLSGELEREAISVSVTRTEDEVFLSILNLDLSSDVTGSIRLVSDGVWTIKEVRRLVCDDIRAHNTFEEPQTVWPENIPLESITDQSQMKIPAQSITTVRMEVLAE